MKVYACPAEVPPPEPDYKSFDWEKERAAEERHQAQLKTWLISKGYKGKHTGGVVSFPVADGGALYMLADGPKSFLVHLPYGDAYQYRDVGFLPKSEIVRRIEQGKKLTALFQKKAS